jgi:helicase MOV-10
LLLIKSPTPVYVLVAVTRAQALLIIVGDPQVLSLDPFWRAFLNYVYLNGGWTGLPDIAWDPEAEAEVDEAGGYDRHFCCIPTRYQL